jgi:hypothetical protein
MPNQNLQNYLDKRMSQPTVILCFKVLLDNVIINGQEARMTKAEINRAFDKEHKNFAVQTFRSDYLLRQSGENPDNAIGVESDGNKFYIRPTFLNGLTPKDLQLTIEKINRQFLEVTAKQKVLYDEISKAGNLSIEKRKEFIIFMLLKKETDRKGQSFEVTAFAILKTFYSIRGFELNRFSTIYSNDGGIDYTSQTSIYQVTTKLSDKKFEDDIDKAPLKNRIFVFREAVTNFDFSKMDNELVSDYISADDLLNHLDYLFLKKPEVNSSLILNTILTEFQREYYL